MDRADAVGSQQLADSDGNDELRLFSVRQPAQRGQIQMIVVIVAEQHDIDAGKILPPHAGRTASPRPDPA